MNDLFYVCTMIEYVARSTHNHVRNVVNRLSDDDIEHQLRVASVNHCLSMEQVCDEWIEDFGIPDGDFDNISSCNGSVPSVTAIGKVYQVLIEGVMKNDVIETMRDVYNSFISDKISDYNSGFYRSIPEEVKRTYIEE